MFQFSPLAPLRVTGHCACGVAPFRYLRIKAWSAAPRSFSQLSHVFHRLLVPRHPPKALSSLTMKSFVGPFARPNPRPHATLSCKSPKRPGAHVRGFRSRDPTHVWVLALSYYRYSDVKVPVWLRSFLSAPPNGSGRCPRSVESSTAFFRVCCRFQVSLWHR